MNASGSGIGLNPLVMALGSASNPSNNAGLSATEPFSKVLDQYQVAPQTTADVGFSAGLTAVPLGQPLPLLRQELPLDYALSVADLLTQIDGLVTDDLAFAESDVATMTKDPSPLSLLVQPESAESLVNVATQFGSQEHGDIAQDAVAAVIYGPVMTDENRHQIASMPASMSAAEASESSDVLNAVAPTIRRDDGVDTRQDSLGIERVPNNVTVAITSANSAGSPLMNEALAAQMMMPDQGTWQSNTSLENSVSAVTLKMTAADVNLQQPLTVADARLHLGRDTEQWTPALGGRILAMVADGIQEARIHLDPPELGSLEIRMRIQNDQATIQVQVQSPQVRDILESHAQRLRDALAEQGLQLAGFDVSEQSQQGFAGQSNSSDWDGNDELVEDDQAEAPASQRVHNGLLDTFA